jgi:hypothetical protein
MKFFKKIRLVYLRYELRDLEEIQYLTQSKNTNINKQVKECYEKIRKLEKEIKYGKNVKFLLN